jgi:hypothetical protein
MTDRKLTHLQKSVLVYLQNSGGWHSPTDVGIHVAFLPRCNASSWGSRLCLSLAMVSLLRRGLLERNHRGHYRYIGERGGSRGREIVTIQCIRFRDDEGRPTCVRDFKAGEACLYYRLQFIRHLHMGMSPTCVFAPYASRGLQQELLQDETRVVPGEWCPLFGEGAVLVPEEK